MQSVPLDLMASDSEDDEAMPVPEDYHERGCRCMHADFLKTLAALRSVCRETRHFGGPDYLSVCELKDLIACEVLGLDDVLPYTGCPCGTMLRAGTGEGAGLNVCQQCHKLMSVAYRSV